MDVDLLESPALSGRIRRFEALQARIFSAESLWICIHRCGVYASTMGQTRPVYMLRSHGFGGVAAFCRERTSRNAEMFEDSDCSVDECLPVLQEPILRMMCSDLLCLADFPGYPRSTPEFENMSPGDDRLSQDH
jgi:hypothetical protein